MFRSIFGFLVSFSAAMAFQSSANAQCSLAAISPSNPIGTLPDFNVRNFSVANTGDPGACISYCNATGAVRCQIVQTSNQLFCRSIRGNFALGNVYNQIVLPFPTTIRADGGCAVAPPPPPQASVETKAAITTSLYQVFLGREPEAAGFNFWISQSCGSIGVGIPGSSESLARMASVPNGVFVANLYVGLLGRQPDPGGYAGWTNALDAGQIDRVAAIHRFVGSDEYRARCP